MARPKTENPKALVHSALKAAVEADGNLTQASRDSGVSRTTLHHRVFSMGPLHPGVKVRGKNAAAWAAVWAAERAERAKTRSAKSRVPGPAASSDPSAAVEDETKEFLRAEVKRLKKQTAQAQRKELKIVEAVREVWATDPTAIRLPAWTPAAPDRRRAKDSEFYTLAVSDLQGGKVTPTYDFATLRERVETLTRKVNSITDRRRAHAVVDDAWLFFIGDIVEGEIIYPGQHWDIEVGTYTQMKFLTEICSSIVLQLARVFPRLRVRWLSGNHGRVGKINLPSSPKTNWDRVTGDLTKAAVYEALLRNGVKKPEEAIEFENVMDWYSVERLPGGWGLFSTHGDFLGGSGTPNALTNAFRGWADVVDEPWDFGQCGHFHNAMMLPIPPHRFAFVNGATESPDSEFNARIKKTAVPAQWSHYWTEDHGLISSDLITLVPRVPYTQGHVINYGQANPKDTAPPRPRQW